MRLVSAADKLHNARMLLADFRSSGDDLWERFNASQAEILWFYREVVSILGDGGTSPLVDELERTVSDLEAAVKGHD